MKIKADRIFYNTKGYKCDTITEKGIIVNVHSNGVVRIPNKTKSKIPAGFLFTDIIKKCPNWYKEEVVVGGIVCVGLDCIIVVQLNKQVKTDDLLCYGGNGELIPYNKNILVVGRVLIDSNENNWTKVRIKIDDNNNR